MEDLAQYAFFIVGILTTSLFLLGRYADQRKILFFAMSIITIFMAVRYNWGSDYMNYYKNFNIVAKTGVLQHFEINSVYDFFLQDHDVGWYALVYIFSGTSFYFFIACLTVFEMSFVYYSIRRYVDKRWYWLAFSIFIFHPYILLLMVATIRQFLVHIIFIWATLIIDKKFKLSLIMMLSSVSIHLSALYFIPIVLFTYYFSKSAIPVKNFVILILLSYVISIFIHLPELLTFGNERVEGYLDGSRNTHLGLVVAMLIVVNIVLFASTGNLSRKERLVVYLYSLSSIVYPFTGDVKILQRLTYFHIMYGFLAIPIIFQQKNTNKTLRLFVFIAIFTFIAINLSGFFKTEIYGDGYGVYQTIFSAPDF